GRGRGRGLEGGADDVELGMNGEAHCADLAGDAVREGGARGVGRDGDADGAAVLDRGADVDLGRVGRAAGGDVAAVVEDGGVLVGGEVGLHVAAADLDLLDVAVAGLLAAHPAGELGHASGPAHAALRG